LQFINAAVKLSKPISHTVIWSTKPTDKATALLMSTDVLIIIVEPVAQIKLHESHF